MNYSINLKVMRKLRDSERGQLTTERDRNSQINYQTHDLKRKIFSWGKY